MDPVSVSSRAINLPFRYPNLIILSHPHPTNIIAFPQACLIGHRLKKPASSLGTDISQDWIRGWLSTHRAEIGMGTASGIVALITIVEGAVLRMLK